MTNEEAFAKIDLAHTYYIDGAPKTALKILKEVAVVLGEDTVKPMMKLCRRNIRQRNKLLRGVG